MDNDKQFNPETCERTIVVAAASRHGSTNEIADHVADRLRRTLPANWCVSRSDPGNAWSLADADAVVLGSAIYFGRWLRPARRALRRIDGRPHVWLFSSGPILPDDPAGPPDSSEVDGHPHAMFGGRLDVSRLSRFERIVARLVHAELGDRRDWTAIDAWADAIGVDLNRTFNAHHTTGARS